jgi:hypothetical protein
MCDILRAAKLVAGRETLIHLAAMLAYRTSYHVICYSERGVVECGEIYNEWFSCRHTCRWDEEKGTLTLDTGEEGAEAVVDKLLAPF